MNPPLINSSRDGWLRANLIATGIIRPAATGGHVYDSVTPFHATPGEPVLRLDDHARRIAARRVEGQVCDRLDLPLLNRDFTGVQYGDDFRDGVNIDRTGGAR